MNILRANILHLLERHNLTANGLAQSSGASQSTISRILKGDITDPRTQSLLPIAQYFDMAPEDLRGQLLPGAGGIEAKLTADAEAAQPSRSNRNGPPNTLKHNLMHWGKAIETEVEGLLPQRLRENMILPNEPRNGGLAAPYHFDYISKNVVAEFKLCSFSTKDGRQVHALNWADRIGHTLWQLSSLRLATLQINPTRRYFLFFFFIDSDADRIASYVQPPTEFLAITSEAALHDIAIVQTTPITAASIIQEAEML